MFNVSMSRVFFPGENRYCLVDVHYKVVPSFPYKPPRVAFIRVITVYESTTCFSELFRMYISISTDIFFSW